MEPSASGGCGVSRVEDEEESIRCVAGMEGQPQKPLFPARNSSGSDIQESRSGWLCKIRDHTDATTLLHDKEAIRLTRGSGQGDRRGEPQTPKSIARCVLNAGR